MAPDAGSLVDGLRAAPARTGVFLDFDGTLSPIVLDPAEARPLPGVAATLATLHGAYGRVAVISGRPVSFLAAHLPGQLELHGLYGLERRVEGAVVVHPGALDWRSVLDEVADLGRDGTPDGVSVEHKGWSVTLHFRSAPSAAAATQRWAEQVGISTGLHVRPAKMSVELHPPVAVDKGTAVTELAAGLDAACFVGDDAGDLPAFDALDRLAADGCATVRVAVETSEAPPEMLERADLRVAGPAGALAFLRSLLL